MRSFTAVGLLGSFLLVIGIQAQSLSEHAAAAAGATIGTAAGKPLSNAITKIFGQVDTDTKKAADQKVDTKTQPKTTAPTQTTAPTPSPLQGLNPPVQPLGASSTASPEPRRRTAASSEYRQASAADPSAIAPVAIVPVVIPEPPRKEPTSEELASVKIGATASEVLAVLGPPESRVVIPDDGHLLEICQYWAKGKQLGTVRMDNGQVVTVEARTEN